MEPRFDLRKVVWPVLALLGEAALQISGYKNVPLAIVLGVLGVLLAIYAAWPLIRREQRPSASERQDRAEPVATPQPVPKSEERTFIDVTPAYLVGLFEGHTDLQAKPLTQPFVGKWMRVSGALGNVLSNRETISQVTFQSKSLYDPDYEAFTVYMYFDRNQWDSRLATLPPGSSITVVGRLREVDRVTVHLEHCELEDELRPPLELHSAPD